MGHSFGAPKGVINDRIVLGWGLNDSPAKPAKILENSRKNSDFFDFFLQNFPEVPNFSKNTIKIGASRRAKIFLRKLKENLKFYFFGKQKIVAKNFDFFYFSKKICSKVTKSSKNTIKTVAGRSPAKKIEIYAARSAANFFWSS